MGDGHHRAREALQKQLEPVDTFGVQVVGGFVQQQHVGPAEQQTAQSHTAFFTTREFANDGIPRGQTQSVGCNFELVIGRIARCGNDGFQLGLLGGERIEVGVFFSVGCIDFFEASLRRFHFAHAAFNRFAHGFVGVHLGLLGQIPNFESGHGNGFAFNFLVDAGHDFQQGGLAGTVQAEHTNFGARKEAKGNVFENLTLRRHDLADAVHGKNVLGHGWDALQKGGECAFSGMEKINSRTRDYPSLWRPAPPSDRSKSFKLQDAVT